MEFIFPRNLQNTMNIGNVLAWLAGLVPASFTFGCYLLEIGRPAHWPLWVFLVIALGPVFSRAFVLTIVENMFVEVPSKFFDEPSTFYARWRPEAKKRLAYLKEKKKNPRR
jgi:hypothetical protein